MFVRSLVAFMSLCTTGTANSAESKFLVLEIIVLN